MQAGAVPGSFEGVAPDDTELIRIDVEVPLARLSAARSSAPDAGSGLAAAAP